MIPISKYFTMKEVTYSDTANSRGIDNSLPSGLLTAAMRTGVSMDLIRGSLGKAIHVDSWYRCPTLNRLIGSLDTSQHLKAEAVDFVSYDFGSPLQICKKILESKIQFDQLILEYTWVHVSFKSNPNETNRMNVLSLLASGKYASGLTDVKGNKL